MKTNLSRRLGGHVSTAGGLAKVVERTLAIGGNCFQIFAGSPRMWHRRLYTSAEIQAYRQAAAQHDIQPAVIHALYLTNLASDKPELRQKSRQALIMDLKNAALMQAAGVVLHIGSHQGRGFEAVKDLVVTEIKQVLAETPDNAILMLENVAGQKGKVGSLAELSFLLDQLNSPRVKVCIDTAHAFEAGYALNNPLGLDMFVQHLEKYIGIDNILILHLNDSKTKLGSNHDVHANIGEGFIGKTGIKNVINHPKLKHLPLILEVPGFDGHGPDKQNIEIVKSLLIE